jgi:hypothetical protein
VAFFVSDHASGASPLGASKDEGEQMKFLSAATGQTWASTAATPNSPKPENDKAQEMKGKLEQIFTEILVSENLMALAGLGSTMCIKDAAGKLLAPTMGQLWDRAKAEDGDRFEKIKTRVRYKAPPEGDNIEVLLSHCQLLSTLEPEDKFVSTFISDVEASIVRACRFVDDGTDLGIHKAFLRRVARRSTRKPRMKLFTTNYDLCFERAASGIGFIAVDGFSHTQPQQFDGGHFNYDLVRRGLEGDAPDYIPNVFHLLKMHGSVDWGRAGSQIVKTAGAEPRKPLIIYPRLSKFESSYEQTFLEMMSRFQASLRQPNTGVLVIGFGFNDSHVTQPLLSALDSNVNLKMIVVDPGLEASTNKTVAALKKLIGEGDWRITLVADKFETVVPAIPDLVAQSELEQHRQRVAAQGGKP